MFKNVFAHPKTTVMGLLTSVATMAGVLIQHGLTFGHVGTGNYVTLAASVATALLGMLAKDPGSSSGADDASAMRAPASRVPTKLPVIMLCALLLSGTMPVMGCNAQSTAQNIVNWTPALESAMHVVSAEGSLLDPQAGPVFAQATAGFDAGVDVLVTEAKAYLANPNAGTLAQLQTAVVTLQQTVNTGLLQAARIVNPASQQKALADINAVAVIVTAMLALVASISGKAALARMERESPIKTAQVWALIDQGNAERAVAAHYDVSLWDARVIVGQARWQLASEGL